MKRTSLLWSGILFLLLLLLPVFGCGSDEEAEEASEETVSEEAAAEAEDPKREEPSAETEDPKREESSAETEDPKPEEPSAEAEDPKPEEPPAGAEEQPPEEDGRLEAELEITIPEAIAYVRRLSPSQLGLSGEDMKIYEILPNSFIVPVDGLLCSELMVYSKNETTGTNELMGKYLISRGTVRRLYRVDDETGEAVQLDLSARPGAVSAEPEGNPAGEGG